jgi:hypothetical protein
MRWHVQDPSPEHPALSKNAVATDAFVRPATMKPELPRLQLYPEHPELSRKISTRVAGLLHGGTNASVATLSRARSTQPC